MGTTGYQPIVAFGEDELLTIHGLNLSEAANDLRTLVRYARQARRTGIQGLTSHMADGA